MLAIAHSDCSDELLAERITMTTRKGLRKVLVLTPRSTHRLGRERMLLGSKLDAEILATVKAQEQPVQAVLFCARSDHKSRSWGMSEELRGAELDALGYTIVKQELALYLELAHCGVFLFASVELGLREIDAYRAGCDRLSLELERDLMAESDPGRRSKMKLDLWLLRNIPLYTSSGLEWFRQNTLPEALPMLEHRLDKLRELGIHMSSRAHWDD